MYRFALVISLFAFVSCDSHEWDGPEGTKRIFEPHGSHGDHGSHDDAHGKNDSHAEHTKEHDADHDNKHDAAEKPHKEEHHDETPKSEDNAH